MCPCYTVMGPLKNRIMILNFTFNQKSIRQLEGQLRKTESIMKGGEFSPDRQGRKPDFGRTTAVNNPKSMNLF